MIELILNKNISKKLFSSLFIKNNKLGSFNILPKIHKSKFGTRPIINCIKHPTANLALLIDGLLQPFVQNSESFIKDSQNLIQKLNLLNLSSNIKLCSFDFESLYSNIELKDALLTISDFMKDKLDNNHIDIIGFYNILKMVFYNNVFSFNKKFYRQIKGVAMGSKCGPTVANIYLYCLEINFLKIYKPIFYGRYIDDIFCIFKDNFDTSILINNFFKNLILNEVTTEVINFLDLNIYKDKVTNQIKFSLFIKPTHTFSYLLTSSNHPYFVIKNLPKGIFIRIRRICSSLTDFFFFSNKVLIQLKSRGYVFKSTQKMLHSIALLNRNVLLEYKNRINTKSNNNFFVSYFFDNNFLNIKNDLKRYINNLSPTYIFKKNTNITFIQKMQPNIGALTNNFIPSYIFDIKKFRYRMCMKVNCIICKFSLNINYLFLPNFNNFFLKIYNNKNCNTNNLVHVIKCIKCDAFYIGETGRSASKRISEHIQDISKFLPYKKYTSVSRHFNLKGHIEDDFKFFIYKSDFTSSYERKYTERTLIYFFKKFNIHIINEDFPSIYNNLFQVKI